MTDVEFKEELKKEIMSEVQSSNPELETLKKEIKTLKTKLEQYKDNEKKYKKENEGLIAKIFTIESEIKKNKSKK